MFLPEDAPKNSYWYRRSRKNIIVAVIGIIILTAIILAIVFALKKSKDDDDKTTPNTNEFKANIYKNAAVASDAELCSKVGAGILKKRGSAADGAIATLFCLGVINLHSCGIGGGGFLVFYQKAQKTFTIYDYREVAPIASTETMFVNKPNRPSVFGGLATGVPGQVKGLWTVHQKHGELPWSELLEPAIKLAEEGFLVTKPVAGAIKSFKKRVQASISKSPIEGLKKLLIKPNGEYLVEGELLRNPELAKTLKDIQKNNITSFYEGDLAKQIVKDIKNASGIITLEDLKNYTVKIRSPLEIPSRNDLKLHTMTAPGGGPVVAMIHNIMSGYDFSKMNIDNAEDQVKFYHKLVESMKFSFAQRGLLGDPEFLPKENITRVLDLMTNLTIGEKIRKNRLTLDKTHEPAYYGGYWGKDDWGTSHLSLLAENGDAVSATESINTRFGSLFRSPTTGIIFNNEMDDFSTPNTTNVYGYPATENNYIKPGKRPLSSMSPSIVTDKNGDVKMICGASGGSRIITGTAQVLFKKLFLGIELGKAVKGFRLHHQGVPNEITVNPNNPPPKSLQDGLKRIGHKFSNKAAISVVQAVYKDGDNIYAVSDPRKHGKPDGY